ncbi:ATP-binding protein [Amycolatopsis sp. Poz14]|uniref:AAA family ATPase n=1 Tax=Amycolatopsis sp. Poz14 TaxID=1447705 RepID=UPI001EE90364|nr:ATP-binding protein [Amycolatopsis sp. Poz14]MCG3755863.1 AAA family ATPase [Amycolatopsis sp. Poz14]
MTELQHADIPEPLPDGALPLMGENSGLGLSATDDVRPPITIRKVSFQRFKQFKDTTITLRPGVSLIAGGNNSGKTSLLHGLAVWEFCRTATRMERGEEGLLPEATDRQGFGLGDEQFSPINVPSLKHLWTNLKSAKEPDAADGGYTLHLTCEWEQDGKARELGFGLALVNDRLFIKTASSNLASGDPAPRIAYLPPFAGIMAREERINGAIRRRRIGEGLAGAVLRNLLLDMQQANLAKRAALRERPAHESGKRRTKISDADLKRLREEDPWELLLQALRGVFNAELQVKDFREEYHSYIEVLVDKGTVDGYKFKRHPGYNLRDLMVEGSGFLQWLSVYTLATSPDADVLLFDEPDAHLHPTLQQEMLGRLEDLASSVGKQVLLATHSSEILRNAEPSKILQIKPGGSTRYLSEPHQKIGLLEGLGSDYAPRIDQVRKAKHILFVEGTSDIPILKHLAQAAGLTWPTDWVAWHTTASHKERKNLWRALIEDIPGIVAVSLRDRDDEALNTVGDHLQDANCPDLEGFHARKWRRRYIEAYLLWPPTLAACSGKTEDEVTDYLRDHHAIAIGSSFVDRDAPQTLIDVRAKNILTGLGLNAIDVAKNLPAEAICEDVLALLKLLNDLA